MKISQRIKELREERGISRLRLSKEIGYSHTIIAYWENGVRMPTADAIISLAVFFGVTSDYLLGLEDETGAKVHISDSFNNFHNSGTFKL